MPSRQQEIESYHEQVEEQLKKILLRFEYFLKSGDGRNDAALIKELDKILQQALQLVYRGPLQPSLSSDQLPYPLF